MEEGNNKQALYRRYRSTSFDELVGQEHITNLLKAAVEKGTFSHAYLFTGQRGTGKTSAARILAYAINGLPYDADAGHLDIIEIDAASNRRIDDIRDLREKVFIAPVAAKYKVYIIDEVHMLTGESFNALLKTIEEPPAHAVFILATTELHKVPATILSRTQRFHFRPVAADKVVAHLKMIAKKEKIDIEDAALQLIAEHGGGSFRDSISLLDQLGSLGGTITAEAVEVVLGRARSEDIADILHLLETGNQSTLNTTLQQMLSSGTSPVTLAEQLTSKLLSSGPRSKTWYELIEKLMSVPKANFPQLLLTSTLLGFTATEESGRGQQVEGQQPAAENKSQHRPSSNETTQQVREAGAHSAVVQEGTSSEMQPQQITSAETTSLPARNDTVERGEERGSDSAAEFDWDKVLTTVKKSNPALHAVLARAHTDFNGKTLTLSFQYALHRKKLEQQQYRTQLIRLVHDVCGINPDLIIQGVDSQVASTNETERKVADLMGGGDHVTV